MSSDPTADSTTTTTSRDAAAVPATPAPAGPDWSALPADVLCPLCEYNLRGLADPRCPECGYRFEWAALLNADRTRHPYLFEHHPELNLRSFVRTLIGSAHPAQFWRGLRPEHAPVLRRILAYWDLSMGTVIVPLAIGFAYRAFSLNATYDTARRSMVTAMGRSPWVPRSAQVTPLAKRQAYAEQVFPRPTSATFWMHAFLTFVDRSPVIVAPLPRGMSFGRGAPLWSTYLYRTTIAAALLYVAWPWATVAVLMIFRQSMRAANVRTVHVLRAVAYACDASWLVVSASVLGVVFLPSYVQVRQLGFFMNTGMLIATFVAAFTTWRLTPAYRHYLQFNRPLLTVAASQIIVLLAACVYSLER